MRNDELQGVHAVPNPTFIDKPAFVKSLTARKDKYCLITCDCF